MALNGRIEGGAAVLCWFAAGATGLIWLRPKISALRKKHGALGIFRLKPGTPEHDEVMDVQVRIIAFFIAWLALFAALDWLF